MSLNVATLVAPPGNLADADVARLAGTVLSPSTNWLSAGEAVDLIFEGSPAALLAAAAEMKLDLILQKLATREKKLLIADMDSTLIAQECIDELADVAGLGAQVAEITERTMQGELDFDAALRERVNLLKDLRYDVINTVLAERITLSPGAKTLCATFRARGGYVAIVSGGFTPFTGAVAGWIGAQEHRSNKLIVEDGRLTGQVGEPILGAEAKLQALIDLRTRLACAANAVLAVGDGANDLAMLEHAGLGVAYHAKPKVAAAAHARIDHTDLTALLFACGIRREDFISKPNNW